MHLFQRPRPGVGLAGARTKVPLTGLWTLVNMRREVVVRKQRLSTATLKLSSRLKDTYSEIVPVLSGQGKACSITLLGRRRDDPSKLDKILSQAWKQGERVSIVWSEDSQSSTQTT